MCIKAQSTQDLSILQRDIHLIEIKHCEDTRPQNQLSAVQEQHRGLCSIRQGASVTLHTILLGVGATIHIFQASCLPNLIIPDVPFPALLSTLILRRFQVKPATLLIPIDLFLFLLVEEFYGTRYQSDPFSKISVESGFHCLQFLLFPSCTP